MYLILEKCYVFSLFYHFYNFCNYLLKNFLQSKGDHVANADLVRTITLCVMSCNPTVGISIVYDVNRRDIISYIQIPCRFLYSLTDQVDIISLPIDNL